MLNELHSLSKALSGMDINVQHWHREYLTLPKVGGKAPCVRIWIDSNGEIPGFDCISKELAAELRKYGNKQGTFPAFNAAPLYRLTDETIIKEFEQILKNPATLDIENIQNWCTSDNWGGIAGKIKLSIVGKAMELEAKIGKAFPDQKNSLTALLEAIKKFSDNRVEVFKLALEKRIIANLQSGQDVPLALAMLFHKGDPKKESKNDHGSISVILDYAGWQDYGHPVASESQTKWINDVLLQTDSTTLHLPDAEDGDGALDAFGQPFGHFENTPMPAVSMAGLGGVSLRSMFNEVHCQKRYGRFDGDSFPVSMQTRADTKAALEYLSSPANKRITWETFGDKEIVFAYPSKLDKRSATLDWLTCIAPRVDDSEQQERFELRAEDFIRAFNALSPQHKPDTIRVFSLRKMDNARTKVVFTHNMTPVAYIDCAEKWQKGCANIPEYNMLKPLTPFPTQIAALCNDVWKRNGELASTGKSRLGRIQYYQGIDLFLGSEDIQGIVYYLRLLLQNCQGLFIFVGNQRYKKEHIRPFVDDKLSKVVPLLGLFLYKGGHEKEFYMQSAGYLVGQLLKLSDELHAMYCRVKRNGDIPPQLVGNSVFITATETPIKALALLGQRMPPYLAWAGQYSRQKPEGAQEKGKEAWRAGWLLRLYGELGAKLEEVLEKTTRFDEFERAQVFLGYLADFPKQQKTSDNEHHNTEEGQDNE